MTVTRKARKDKALPGLDSAGKRRRRIIEYLGQHGAPVAGGELARRFRVSRQCLVQDVAILRAGGEQIVATPQGYRLPESSSQLHRAILACRHSPERTQAELEILVDHGVKVLDV